MNVLVGVQLKRTQNEVKQMLRASMSLALLIAGCTAVPASNIDDDINIYSLDTDGSIFHFELDEDVQIGDISDLQEDYGFQIQDIEEIRFHIGDISGGFTPNWRSSVSLEMQFVNGTADHFDNLIVSAPVDDPEIEISLTDSFSDALRCAQYSELEIDSIDLNVHVQNMAESEIVIEAVSYQVVESVEDEETQQATPFSYYNESWAPYYMYSDASDTFAFQYLKFNNVSAFGTHLTYEAEWQIYEPDMRYGSTWSTTFPDSYRDTTFWDRWSGLRAFAVGTGSPELMSNYHTYYASTSLSVDLADRDSKIWVSIKGQKAEFVSSWCEGRNYTYAWCIGKNRVWTSLIDGYWIDDYGPFITYY